MGSALLSALLFGLATPWAIWSGSSRGTSWRQVLSRWRVPPALSPVDVWLHGASGGEVRALEPLIRRLQQQDPPLRLALSAGNSTGLQEARRLLPEGLTFLLPFDLSWVMNRLARLLKPRLLVLSEGDLWWNMLRELRKRGTRILVAGAKLSERSQARWSWCPWLARRLWGQVDLFCAQSDQMAERIRTLVPEAQVEATGSLKMERCLERLDARQLENWRERLQLRSDQPVVLCGSTHPGEELLLLRALDPLMRQGWQVVVCPRHPQRLQEVEQAVEAAGMSPLVEGSSEEGIGVSVPRVHLVARFGVLTELMQLADVVVLGGSFCPGIGGHNILEPVQLGRPVLWGPHMETQQDLVRHVVDSGAGESCAAGELTERVLGWWGKQVGFSQQQETALQKTWERVGVWLKRE